MDFVKLEQEHIKDAATLALKQYKKERQSITFLPIDDNHIDVIANELSKMTENGLGIAMMDGGTLVGFMAGHGPIKEYFGTSDGVFLPIHGHGVATEDKKKAYTLLYQKAAESWVKKGLLSHVISVYSHDTEAIDSFFHSGFGIRCVDAIYEVKSIPNNNQSDITFDTLKEDEYGDIANMTNDLIGHLHSSPMFMSYDPNKTADSIKNDINEKCAKYIIAKDKDKIIGHIKLCKSGENFACDAPDMANICGAYLLPEYRGRGIYSMLLNHTMEILKAEGYKRCGVDYESFNPTANYFWTKYFTPYTYSLHRRIDERILK